jgi:ankyrin repeat protein
MNLAALAFKALADRDLAALKTALRTSDAHHARFPVANTLLHVAAARGYVGETQALIAAGAVIDARNGWGATPLWMAAQAGRLDVVRVLLDAGADRTLADLEDTSPLDVAAAAGHDVVCVALMNHGLAEV